MSTTIDERIVEMRFDNKQFESGVQTSMSTLDRLKQSLRLDDASRGFENINAAASGVKMDGLSSAVDTVRMRFSALQVIAVEALRRITDSVINTGKQMIKSLAIEPIAQGFEEYELKMGSVQTIMAGTGASLEDVMKKLNELNAYADKTIYSFSDMTTNIGKFTNAGVSLDDAVAAIQGVANVAAVSGANANEASRAMYNFAQALSTGFVRYIDWKSIENANMATVEFKQQLLEAAVAAGKMEKTSDGMYKVLSTNSKGKTMPDAISATKNFNDSLNYQWMTTEVLTAALGKYSDETTDIGKKAADAAQSVKTFTQLMDTLKEAVGSGWAETWENIFGDFNEAKALWTEVSKAVGGLIDQTSTARNSLLKTWKELGGRTELIFAVRNAVNALSSVLKPVAEAFREIFPPTTAERLLDLTVGLKTLTSHLKINEETAERIKSTFKGFFAVLDIIRQAVSALFKGLVSLFDFLPGLGGGILGVTSKMGDWLVKLDETITKNDTFNKAVQGTVAFIKSIPDKIDSVFQKLTGISIGDAFDWLKQKASDLLDKLKEVFEGFKDVDTSGIDSLTERVKRRLEPLGKLFDGIKKLFAGLWALLKKLAPVFSSIAEAIGEAFGKIGEWISKAAGDADFNSLLDLLNSGILVAIGIGLKKFIDSMTGIAENAGGFIGSITGILDSVKGCFVAWQNDIKANILTKIATAVLMLTAALVVLSLIDSTKLTIALTAISTEFLVLLSSLKVLTSMTKELKGSGVTKAIASMTAMAAAVLILSIAVKQFATLSWEDAAKGVAGVTVLLTELALLSKIAGSKNAVSGSAAMLAMAAAVTILIPPLKVFAGMTWEEIAKGLVTLAGALGIIVGAMKLMDVGATVGAAAMLIMAAALDVLIPPLKVFGNMSWEEICKGLVELAGALGIIAVAANLMTGAIAGAAAMVVMAAAIAVLAPALKLLGSMTWDDIARGLVALAGAFTVIGVAGLVLAPISPIILALGAAVALLGAGALACGVGVTALAAGLAALAVTGGAGIAVLTAAITGIVLLIPLILTKIGEGIVALIVTIGESAPEIAKAILKVATASILALSETIPLVVSTVVKLIETTLQTIAEHLPAIVQAGFDILLGFLDGVRNNIREVVIMAYDILTEFLAGIAEKIPDVIQAGIDIVISLIDGLAAGITDNAPRMREAFINLFHAMIDAIKTFLGIHSPSKTFLEMGWDIIQGLIDGIGEMISSVVTKITEVATSMVNAIKEKLGQFLTKGKEVVTNIKEGIANKISEVRNKVTEVVTNCINALKEKLTQFKEKGKEFITNLKNGVNDKVTEIKNAVKDLVSKALTAIQDKIKEWKSIGENLIDGLKEGIQNAAKRVVNAAKDVVNGAIEGAKKLLGIHSPSKVFEQIGKFADMGLINGLKEYSSKVADASESVGRGAMDSISDVISGIADTIENGMDSTPTIRPVLDLDDVVSGINSMDRMFDTQRSINLAGQNSYEINRNAKQMSDETTVLDDLRSIMEDVANNQNGAVTNNTFNITGDNPREIAEEVSRIIQRQIERREASWA